MNSRAATLATILWALAACGGDREAPAPPGLEPARVLLSRDSLTDAEIESGRRDGSWREAVVIDRRFDIEAALDTIAIPESWRDLRTLSAEETPDPSLLPPVHLPLFGEVEGPSVLYVQILLDRARFSPGILDGKWGKNTEKAVYWLQVEEGLPATGLVDSTTFARLSTLAGDPDLYVRDHALSAEEVGGPFVRIPANVYAQRRLACMCYGSLSEKLSERFHTSAAVLGQLNPEAVLDSLEAGDRIRVPNLAEKPPLPGTEPPLARLLVSGRGYYLHGLDGDGRILYHFPTTLGARYDPSPQGRFEVVSVTPDPWFHWQPNLLSGVDDRQPNTLIPPGPNSPVGRVWIKLSAPHYGIHGTREPATIGYESSSGCVRLTNWDAMSLATRLKPGTPVEFEATRLELEPPNETSAE